MKERIQLASLFKNLCQETQEVKLLFGCDGPFRCPSFDRFRCDLEKLDLVVRRSLSDESVVNSKPQGGVSGDRIEEERKPIKRSGKLCHTTGLETLQSILR